MARFETEGLDEIVESMKKQGELAGKVADKMLLAAAEDVKQAWRAEAERRQFRDTGDMISSIDFKGSPKTVADVKMIDIYPQGKSGKTTNVAKAFILHWGTTGARAQKKQRKTKKFSGPGIPRTLWVDEADKESELRVMETYTRIWDEFLKGSN